MPKTEARLAAEFNPPPEVREYFPSRAGMLGAVLFDALLLASIIILSVKKGFASIDLAVLTGRWAYVYEDVFLFGLVALIAYFILSGSTSVILNWGRPFIVLMEHSFMIGRGPLAIPYASVERFAFKESRLSSQEISFTLFLKPGERTEDQKLSRPFKIKDGRLICKRTWLGRSVTAGQFYGDFGARLVAAGAEDARDDQDRLVRVVSETGEAVIMPKGPLSRLISLIGGVDRQCDLKWFSFRFGTATAVFLVMEIVALTTAWHEPWEIFRTLGRVVGPFVLVPFLAAVMAVSIQVPLTNFLDRSKRIAQFMEEAGEMRKFMLGGTLGLFLAVLSGAVVIGLTGFLTIGLR